KKRRCYCVRRKPRRTRVTNSTRTWLRARERDSTRFGRMKLPPVMKRRGRPRNEPADELSRPVFASSCYRQRLVAFGDPRRHPPPGGWRGGGDRRGVGL